MKKKKIKLFLGAFINVTNAQNLNCLALAKYLNKEKYDIYTMVFKNGDFELPKLTGVTLWTVPLPYRIFRYVIWLKAVLFCDVLYLPKGELPKYIYFWKRLFGKKSFTTIEGAYSGVFYELIMRKYCSKENIGHIYSMYDHVYSITKYMREYNEHAVNIISRKHILYLGTEFNTFHNGEKHIAQLSDIIIIGGDLKRKGIEDFFKMASMFPKLNFHIAGGGVNYNITEEAAKRNLQNIILHGSLSHSLLSELLKKVQLMFFPSRSEGFPKVILECAAAGVPSIVYEDYGADEWITTGKDGYVVETFEQAKEVIDTLLKDPDQLLQMSNNAVELAKRFDWKEVIKDWEIEIDKLAAI